METFNGIPAELLQYLGATENKTCDKLEEVVKKAKLGFENIPHINALHNQTDYMLVLHVTEQLEEVLKFVATGVEDHLDDLHFKRMYEVE